MARKPKKVVESRTYDLPVLLLTGEEWRISDVMSDRLHFHNCLEIGLCHSESGILETEDERLPFRAGDICLVPRHVLHTTCSTPGCKSKWSYLFLDLDKLLHDTLPETLSNSVRVEHFRLLNQMEHPRMYFLVNSLMEELQARSQGYRTVVKHLLALLYIELARMEKHPPKQEIEGRSKKTFPLKPALEYIYAQYMQPCTIDELAALCHLSTTHFRRTFLSVMGTTPLNFLTTMRIEQACSLLIGSNDSVLDIADAVGFASISSFNRAFHQITGLSPKAFRSPATRATLMPQKKCILPYKGWMHPDKQPEFVKQEQES